MATEQTGFRPAVETEIPETALLEAALLSPAYQRIGKVVKTPGPFLVEGKLKRQQGAVHLEVTRLTPFRERERERPWGLAGFP